MALTEERLREILNSLNLTTEELEQFDASRPNTGFDEESALKNFIAEMRQKNAGKTAAKDIEDISFDEIQVAWETVKEAKEEDNTWKTKQVLLQKSEEFIKNFENAPDDAYNMIAAPRLSEWLHINNSKENITEQEKERNAKIKSQLEAFYGRWDAENGIGKINEDRLTQINTVEENAKQFFENFDPLQTENGQLKHPEFKEIKEFYDELIVCDEKGKPLSPNKKEEYIRSMVDVAVLTSIRNLSLNSSISTDTKIFDETKFKASVLETMEEQAIMTVMADKYNRNKQKISLKNLLKDLTASKKTVSEKALAESLKVSQQRLTDIDTRIAQKSGVRRFLSKIRAKGKELEAKHPFLVQAGKTIAKVALGMAKGMAIGYFTGGIGICAYSAYIGYKKIKGFNKARKKENERTGKKQNLAQYLWNHPRKLVSLGFSCVSVGLSVWGVSIDTNLGGLGSINGEQIETVKDFFGLEHSDSAENFSSLNEVMQKTFHSTEGMNAADLVAQKATVMNAKLVNAGAATVHETTGSVYKALKNSKGEAFWTRAGKVFNAALPGLATGVSMFVGRELSDKINKAEEDKTYTYKDYILKKDITASPFVSTYGEIFQGETEDNLDLAANVYPKELVDFLKSKGIFTEDHKFMASEILKMEIQKYYYSHPEADPEELAHYVNEEANKNRFVYNLSKYDRKIDEVNYYGTEIESEAETETNEESLCIKNEYEGNHRLSKFGLPDEVRLKIHQFEVKYQHQYQHQNHHVSHQNYEDTSSNNKKATTGEKELTEIVPLNLDSRLQNEILGYNLQKIIDGEMSEDGIGNAVFMECYLLAHKQNATSISAVSKEEFDELAQKTEDIFSSEHNLENIMRLASTETIVKTNLSAVEVHFEDWQNDPECSKFHHENIAIVQEMSKQEEPWVFLENLGKEGKISNSQYYMIFNSIKQQTDLGMPLDEALQKTAHDFVNIEIASAALEEAQAKTDAENAAGATLGNEEEKSLADTSQSEEITPTEEIKEKVSLETREEPKDKALEQEETQIKPQILADNMERIISAHPDSGITGKVRYIFIEKENGQYKLSDIPPTADFSKDITQDVETSERIMLKRLAGEHLIYLDFRSQQIEGHALSASQQTFMRDHEQSLGNHNLIINDKGRVVFNNQAFDEKSVLNKSDFNSHDPENKKMMLAGSNSSNCKPNLANQFYRT